MPTGIAELFGSQENMDIVRHPDKVDACVLRYIAPQSNDLRDVRYEESEYLAVGDDLGAALRMALLSQSSYVWLKSPLFCIFRYDARLRFHQKTKTVSIDFCYDCMVLMVYRDDTLVGGEMFKDPIFFDSMLRLFPNDPKLKHKAQIERPNRVAGSD